MTDAVLLKPLPYRRANRIVTLSTADKADITHTGYVSAPDFRDWHGRSGSFEALAYYKSEQTAVIVGSDAELAIRASMRASRARMVRQLLTESLFLSQLAGAAGMLCADGGSRALVAAAPPTYPASPMRLSRPRLRRPRCIRRSLHRDREPGPRPSGISRARPAGPHDFLPDWTTPLTR